MPKIVDHEKRRQYLGELAFQLITENGYDAATFRALADAAGCTTGMIVHYFPTRDDILLGALSHAEGITRDRMDYCLNHYEGIEALRQCLYAVMPADRKLGRHWRLWISFWGRATNNDAVNKRQSAAYAEARSRWSEFIVKAQKHGDISLKIQPREEAKSVMALLDGLGVQSMVGKGALTKSQQKLMIDTYLDGMQVRKH